MTTSRPILSISIVIVCVCRCIVIVSQANHQVWHHDQFAASATVLFGRDMRISKIRLTIFEKTTGLSGPQLYTRNIS